jgi:leader peptidase (prepilin peptidase) / N-methyltransferase
LGWAVPACLALAFVYLVLAVIDAATRRLPNHSTYPAVPVVAGLLLAASLGLGRLGRLGRGLLAAASVGGFFLLQALLSPHGMGVGDVKLAPTLGLALGWRSWGTVAVGVVAGYLLAGLAGWAACWHLACRARRGCRSAPGWSPVRCWASWSAARSPAGSRPPRSAPGRPGQLLRTMMRPSMPV